MSKDKMKDEQISFAEEKEFLNKVHDDLINLLEQNKITESYRMYPAEDIFYIMFREYYASQDCLKIVSIVECFELTELVEYNSFDWWFFSTLASDVDTNKITNIIQTKMVEEEKSKINSVLVKEDDVVIKKKLVKRILK
ncbi:MULTISPECIES: hypothetical protein [Pantoea]|uniref:hypothetical protein n=1 Tax=Pantoea TaxID=53335 RepID=UPI00224B3914|nr:MULTISPECIES: hypothetical protein [Pantoea]MCX2904516.1 hypothetical protein [[Curtobacterium] plantarum]MDQ0433854.1 hypothetical protein [Pantoea agglomerans]